MLKPTLDVKSLEFQYENQDAVLALDAPLLLGDALRLRQVLTNLLSNATKFTQKGFVRFGVASSHKENATCVVFTIEDSGIGMSDEQVARLFEKFMQADASITREYGGTGLGLAITGKLVALMGGTIEVKSQLSQGSCFTVEIPFARALVGENPLRERRSSVENFDELKGVRVLLVEDHPVNRKVASNALARAGVVVDIAENGELAVKKLQSLPPETYGAVLMDLQMPVMDGYEATEIIRKDRKFDLLPIIALSTRVMTFEKEKCFQIGMNGFINVPFDPIHLWQSLLRAIRKNTPYLVRNSLQAMRQSIQIDPEMAIQGLHVHEGLNTEAPESEMKGVPDKGLVVDAAWLEAFTDHLGKGDFVAIELWENNSHLLGNRFSPADLEHISKALQQFDFTRALEYFNTGTDR